MSGRREELIQAAARAYCYPVNQHKTLDTDLCEAFAKEAEDIYMKDKPEKSCPPEPIRAHEDCPYIPRNDFVVCEIVKRDTGKGLAMPDISVEGKDNIVRAVGPDVRGLEPGDIVHVIGAHGVAWAFLPGTNKFFCSKQENIPIRMKQQGVVEA